MTTTFYDHGRDVPESDWRWTNFSPAEIACRGTGKLLINTPALDKLQALRDRLGKPLIVHSAWEKVLGDISIAADTRLRFDFSAETEGEIHAIMFTNGETLSRATTIQLLGSQTYGVQAHNDYVAGSGVKSYDIPVGEYFTDDFDRFVFLTDDDNLVGADSAWANIDIA